MTDIKEHVLTVYAYLNGLKDNEAVLKEADWLSFFLSLLPAPGIQQLGQIANKIVTDKELNISFEKVRKEISNTNERISQLESDIDRIREIANTVDNVTNLTKLVEEYLQQIINTIEKDETEFVIDTANWSVQSLINSLVKADWVSISAINHSQNILKDSKVKAKRTHLKAHDNSSNIVRDTEFAGDTGSVTMNGITQKGHISVEGSSVSFHGNSELIFGSPPNLLKGNCPICGALVQVDKDKISGYTKIQCPSCKSVLPFQVD